MMQRFPQIETATRDYRDLFALGLDAVVIATPPATHYAIARDCLEHGLHVLVEKPITLDSEDADRLIPSKACLASRYCASVESGERAISGPCAMPPI